ncbi:hypothetical protein FACS1894111_01500 [Clostridia bacterium]|nr:hypothetical protein FACS1894111_01500 [Clostridia bacterium]
MKHHAVKKHTKNKFGFALVSVFAAGTLFLTTPSFTTYAAGPSAGVMAVLDGVLEENPVPNTTTNDLPVTSTPEDAAAPEETAVDLFGYTNLGIANVADYVNIRSGAGEGQAVVGILPANAAAEILSAEGDWSQIQSGGITGFIKSEFLLTGDEAAAKAQELKRTVAVVHGSGICVRTEPSTEASLYASVSEGRQLDFVAQEGDWVKVSLDGKEEYIHSDYVTVETILPTAEKVQAPAEKEKKDESSSNTRSSLISYAKQFVGGKYVWGGTTLGKGVDCSGFTMRIFEKYGVSLPHSSRAQAGYGKKISASEAQPGDLFFYASGGTIDHVAIYIGGGQIVHASSAKTGIKISSAFGRSPVAVRRVLN